MKRKNLILLITLVLLGVIILLGYNIYNYIDYVPRVEEKDTNIIGNEIIEDTSQLMNLVPVNLIP